MNLAADEIKYCSNWSKDTAFKSCGYGINQNTLTSTRNHCQQKMVAQLSRDDNNLVLKVEQMKWESLGFKGNPFNAEPIIQSTVDMYTGQERLSKNNLTTGEEDILRVRYD